MINVGVIGCGRIAQGRHLPEYSRNENVNIMGVFDLNQGRAEETAKRYGAAAYGSYEELLNDPKIDAVSVCAANYAHAEITTAANLRKRQCLRESMCCVKSRWRLR